MTAETGSIVRAAEPGDLQEIVAMIHEHAAYEKGGPLPSDLALRLAPLLFGAPPSGLRCFVGVSQDRTLVGFSTVTTELSTWQASEFLSMDCLFIRAHARGKGLGKLFMTAVTEEASSRGITIVQWQTPNWNEGAIRFYDRLGVSRSTKQRYTFSQLAHETR